MEFVHDDDVLNLLQEQGIYETEGEGDRMHLRMEEGEMVVQLHVAHDDSSVAAQEGARCFTVTQDQLGDVVESIILKLRLEQVLLIPAQPWRHIFDTVAFSLAENEDWQAVDAAATVELNRRDPLLCEPGDFQILNAMMHALVQDADNPDQGLMLTSTAAPVLVEFVPEGAFHISVGHQVLADELTELFET